MPPDLPLPGAAPLSRRTVLAATAAAAVTALGRPAAARAATAAPGARDPALHALQRLAFGPAPGDLDRVRAQGVAAWVDAQLSPAPGLDADPLPGLETLSMTPRALLRRYRLLDRQAKQQARRMQAAPDGSAPARTAGASGPAGEPRTLPRDDLLPAFRARRDFVVQVHVEAGAARLARAVSSPRQLEEVLVDFWFNHFNVFEGKGLVHVLAGAYERDAIRPHVFGRFRDLLGATAKHPAMLFYLDNWLSVGPGWKAPPRMVNPPSGLNENYARELMELHTLGVDGGYTQADVTQLARIFTGWTFVPGSRAQARAQGDDLFVFDPARHDEGTKTWLGHTVAPRGQAEGEWALDVLAAHPSTARHIATQLARRFVADAPPPALVQAVAARFLATSGDLRETLRALVAHPAFQAAAAAPPMYKTPYEFVVSAVRATGWAVSDPLPVMQALVRLGQPLHGCPTPDGWHHEREAWLNPDAVARRIDFATTLATGRLPLAALPAQALEQLRGRAASGRLPPLHLATSSPPARADDLLATLGPAITPATRGLIDAQPAAMRAALVLGSPDFMHR